MSSIVRFKDGPNGCFSSVRHDDGSFSFVSISQQGVLIKKSRFGLLGKALYRNDDVYGSANVARILDRVVDNLETGIGNPVLDSFTRLALSCSEATIIPDRVNTLIKKYRDKYSRTEREVNEDYEMEDTHVKQIVITKYNPEGRTMITMRSAPKEDGIDPDASLSFHCDQRSPKGYSESKHTSLKSDDSKVSLYTYIFPDKSMMSKWLETYHIPRYDEFENTGGK